MSYVDFLKKYNQLDSKSNEDTLDLFLLIKILNKDKNRIITISLVALIFSIIYALNKKPVWEGQFQIVLAQEQNNVFSNLGLNGINSSLFSSLPQSKNKLTEVEILKSPSVLMPIFEEIKKEKSKKLKKENALENWKYSSWAKDSLEINLKNRTSILNISYKDKDKELVLPTLNKLTKTYEKYSTRTRRNELKEGLTHTANQIQIYKNKLSNLFQEFEKISLEQNIFLIFDSESGPNGITNIEKTRINATKNISEIDFHLEQLKNSSEDSDEVLNIVLSFPVPIQQTKSFIILQTKIDSIMELQKREDKAKQIYKEEDILTRNIIKTKKEAVQSLKKQAQVYLTDLKLYQNSKKDSAIRPSKILTKYKELKYEIDIAQATLLNLEKTFNALKLEKAKSEKPWELITSPTLIDSPIAPNKKLIVFTGTFSIFLLSCIFTLLKAFIKKELYDKEIISRIIGSPLLLDLTKKEDLELDENISLLIKSGLFISNVEELSFVELGNINKDNLIMLLEKFEAVANKNNSITLNNLEESKGKLILIVSLGDITLEKLKIALKKIYLKDKEILGWISI